jgi:hypothetical protein
MLCSGYMCCDMYRSTLYVDRLYHAFFHLVFIPNSLKEDALDRTLWRTRFGRGYGLVVRQITE